MGQIQVSGFVKSLRENTTIYSPIIESITNSIYAVNKTGRTDGYVSIKIIRNDQETLDNSKSEVIGFENEDNGIGFNKENRDSFDTAFSKLKQEYGGKGIGRFIFLKYFETVFVESVFINEKNEYKKRTFEFSKNSDTDIISKEKELKTNEKDTKTKIIFKNLNPRKQFREKNLSTIAKVIFEKILMYFVDEGSNTPQIKLLDEDGESIVLNKYLKDSDQIQRLTDEKFILQDEEKKEIEFTVNIFKIYSPGNQNNKISLLANKIEVEDISMGLIDKIFSEQFVETEGDFEKKYIVKAYITSNFLDKRVSNERTKFDFPDGSASQSKHIFGKQITKKDILEKSIEIVKNNLNTTIKTLSDRRNEHIQTFLDKNPFYKSAKSNVDYSSLSIRPSNKELDQAFHKAQYENRTKVRIEVDNILEKNGFDKEEKLRDVIQQLNQANKEELARYVSERKVILDFLEKALEAKESEKHKKEELLHSIIHPMRTNSDEIDYENHNLWIIDERLNFTNYISSDEPLESKKRPDIIAVRMDNEYSNPITIYELKRPGRDDFVDNPKDDPTLQIVNYRNRIASGELKTPKNRPINVFNTTPFYGYIICELTLKVKNWLEFTKNYTKTPDNDGYFLYHPNINMHIEVISWDKLLRDAKQRNEVFFKKLGF